MDAPARLVGASASAAESALLVPTVAAMRPRYHGLRVPLEIAAGADDRYIDPGAQSVRLHRELPGSGLRVVPGAGHMLRYAAPDEAVAAIDRAARRAPGRGVPAARRPVPGGRVAAAGGRRTRKSSLPEDLVPLHLEYQPGDYERAFALSDAVDPAGIEARVRGGVPHLRLPKAGPAKRQRIEVKADGGLDAARGRAAVTRLPGPAPRWTPAGALTGAAWSPRRRPGAMMPGTRCAAGGGSRAAPEPALGSGGRIRAGGRRHEQARAAPAPTRRGGS